MKRRLITVSAVVLSIAAGANAQQAQVTFDWKWRNARTGDQSFPVPGDLVHIWLDLSFAPAPGGTLLINNQSYTVLGLDTINFDLIAATKTTSFWLTSGSGFQGTPSRNPFHNFNYMEYGRRVDLASGFASWDTGPQGAHVSAPAPPTFTIGSLRNVAAGQMPIAGELPNSVNPIVEIWRAGWTPDDYNIRPAIFYSRKAVDATGTGASLWIYPTGTDPLETMQIYHVPPGNIAHSSLAIVVPGAGYCYANCDGSNKPPILNVDDFTCFIDRFAAGDPYTNCDMSTTEPILNVDDFTCFIQSYAQALWCD